MPSPCENVQLDRLPETTDDQVAQFIYQTPWKTALFQFGGAIPQYPIPNANLATEAVTITVLTHANIGRPEWYVDVWVNMHIPGKGAFIGKFFHNLPIAGCGTESQQNMGIPIPLWNKYVEDARTSAVGEPIVGTPILTVIQSPLSYYPPIGGVPPLGMACGSAGTNWNQVRIQIEYNAGAIISTPVDVSLWTEDLKANVLFAKTTNVPDEHLSAMPTGWVPGYAVHYTVMPCRRVEQLNEFEPNQNFYAKRVMGADGYARLEYESSPVSSDVSFRQSHYARAMIQNFVPDAPLTNQTQEQIDAERIAYGNKIKNIVDQGYAVRLGTYHAPYWIEAIYESEATLCDSAA